MARVTNKIKTSLLFRKKHGRMIALGIAISLILAGIAGTIWASLYFGVGTSQNVSNVTNITNPSISNPEIPQTTLPLSDVTLDSATISFSWEEVQGTTPPSVVEFPTGLSMQTTAPPSTTKNSSHKSNHPQVPLLVSTQLPVSEASAQATPPSAGFPPSDSNDITLKLADPHVVVGNIDQAISRAISTVDQAAQTIPCPSLIDLLIGKKLNLGSTTCKEDTTTPSSSTTAQSNKSYISHVTTKTFTGPLDSSTLESSIEDRSDETPPSENSISVNTVICRPAQNLSVIACHEEPGEEDKSLASFEDEHDGAQVRCLCNWYRDKCPLGSPFRKDEVCSAIEDTIVHAFKKEQLRLSAETGNNAVQEDSEETKYFQ